MSTLLGAERGAGRGPTHVDGAQHHCQRVKRKPERYAVHGCYHRLGNICQCADGVLEVMEMRASWGVHGGLNPGAAGGGEGGL